MTYKETLFFVAQSLTINHEEKNKIAIEAMLKDGAVDWEAVVKLSTAHYVFPALYCNLKQADFLHYVPEDLVAYMIHITDLNRARNQQIIKQAKEINTLLLENGLTPIFLKGAGNLLEGLYKDIAERMVGDIDFIVSKEEYEKTIEVLKNAQYKLLKENTNERKFHWHYPPLVHPTKIGALEVHNKILKKPFEHLFNEETIKKDIIKKSNHHFLSSDNKILNAILPKIINDHLYYSQNISIRTMYDVFLISKNGNYEIELKSNAVFKKFNNFLGCIQMVLNNPDTIKVVENNSLTKFQTSYLLRLHHSKKERLKSNIINYLIRYRDKITILRLAFVDKDYRTFVLKRVLQIDLYKKILGFKPTY